MGEIQMESVYVMVEKSPYANYAEIRVRKILLYIYAVLLTLINSIT